MPARTTDPPAPRSATGSDPRQARGRDERIGTRGQDRMRTTARRRPIERASLARRCVALIAIAAVSLGCVADTFSYSGVAPVPIAAGAGPVEPNPAPIVGVAAPQGPSTTPVPAVPHRAPLPADPDRAGRQRDGDGADPLLPPRPGDPGGLSELVGGAEAPVHDLRRPAGGLRRPARLALPPRLHDDPAARSRRALGPGDAAPGTAGDHQLRRRITRLGQEGPADAQGSRDGRRVLPHPRCDQEREPDLEGGPPTGRSG